MKPLIGVVADVLPGDKHLAHCVQEKYLDAITGGANAIALMLPGRIDTPGGAWTDPADVEVALGVLDGLFLSGATSNVAPEAYGAELIDPESPADPARDHVSLALARAAVARGMPVLGVCRGFQEINVALGGTLHQAVHAQPGLADHREDPELDLAGQYGPAHDVAFTPGGLLHLASGVDHARVNSLHWQGVDRLAPALVPEAVAPDGLIEAFRLRDSESFLLGVQWHPEWAFRDDALSLMIFRSFGIAARAFRAAKARQSRQPAYGA
jgi:putative glutamine amidotransferase